MYFVIHSSRYHESCTVCSWIHQFLLFHKADYMKSISPSLRVFMGQLKRHLEINPIIRLQLSSRQWTQSNQIIKVDHFQYFLMKMVIKRQLFKKLFVKRLHLCVCLVNVFVYPNSQVTSLQILFNDKNPRSKDINL